MKIGHGGTLDPLATGVLIVGVGRGTKHLQKFLLDCTKCYDTTLLFGAETDTYDITGQVIARSPTENVSRAKVEEALGAFRGQIMQRPPTYSALRIQGKRLYEYAREGKELPTEIEQRPVTVKELVLQEWLGNHAQPLERSFIEDSSKFAKIAPNDPNSGSSKPSDDVGCFDKSVELVVQPEHGQTQSRKADGARQGDFSKCDDLIMPSEQADVDMHCKDERIASSNSTSLLSAEAPMKDHDHLVGPPAARLRMTVTSGFYVRSFCHDLGKAVESLGVMGSLIRVRQGQFELGKNVLTYEDFSKDEEVWGPKLSAVLDNWNQSMRDTQGESPTIAGSPVKENTANSLAQGK